MQYFAVIDDIVQSQVFLFNCVSIYSIFGLDKDETCLLSLHTHYLLKPHVGAAKRKNERHMRDKYEGRPHKRWKGLAWLQRPNYGTSLLATKHCVEQEVGTELKCLHNFITSTVSQKQFKIIFNSFKSRWNFAQNDIKIHLSNNRENSKTLFTEFTHSSVDFISGPSSLQKKSYAFNWVSWGSELR